MPNQPHHDGPLPDGHTLIRMAEDEPRFKVRRREGMAALNYVYVTGEPDQFEWPRSDMRGLIVDEASGEVLARPFQKFWCSHEGPALGTDWSEGHVVLPKLDGSLVCPAGSRWVTRGGVTDTSKRAETHAAAVGAPLERLLDAVRTDPDDGTPCTPCFEYVGPDNRIVIEYGRRRLVLLAVRRIADGRYWPTARLLDSWERLFGTGDAPPGLGVVRPLAGIASGADPEEYSRRLAETVAAWGGEDNEGVVVAFEPSGHRVKIKCLEYVRLHRARDDYSREGRILGVWNDGRIAELLPLLAPERARRVRAYVDAVSARVDDTVARIVAEASACWKGAGADRKKAAAAWIARTAERKTERAYGFVVYDALTRGADAAKEVRRSIAQRIERSHRRENLVEQNVRPLLGPDAPRWNPPDGNQRDTDE